MISERTLRQWRKQSLQLLSSIHSYEKESVKDPQSLTTEILMSKELNERILRLTQDMLDLHLLRK